MNVNINDCAIIIGSRKNNGKTVDVKKFIGIENFRGFDEPWWGIYCEGGLKMAYSGIQQYAICPDAWLKKICPPISQLIPDPIEIPSMEEV